MLSLDSEYTESVTSDCRCKDVTDQGDRIWDVKTGNESTDYLTKIDDENNYHQYCTAVQTIYHAINGVAPDLATEMRNRKYVDSMRSGKRYAVLTGWRIYDFTVNLDWYSEVGDTEFEF